jgi:prepilin-type N-terminal cleavage/methylation domain-containing protein
MLARRHHEGPQQTGFTLVELLIVVVILGILAAIAIPRFESATLESKEAQVLGNLAIVRQAIEIYAAQHNGYPTVDIVQQLTGQTDRFGAAGTTYGPYIRGDFPMNPFKGRNDIQVLNTMYHTAYGLQGWMYAQQTGELRMNSPGSGPSGVLYFEM